MKRHLRPLGSALILFITLGAACTRKNNDVALPLNYGGVGNTPITSSTSSTTSTTVTNECSTFSATLIKLNPSTNQIYKGQEVTFQVQIQGCARAKLIRPGATDLEFSGTTKFYKVFNDLGNFSETVEVQPVLSTGLGLKTTISSLLFTVANPPEPILTCSATGSPFVIDMKVKPDHTPIDEYPEFTFKVYSSLPAEVIGADGPFSFKSSFPQPANGLSIRGKIQSVGQNTVAFTVAELGKPWKTARCSASVEVREKIIAPPPPPACIMSVNKNSFLKGEEVTLTILFMGGPANIATVGTQMIDPRFGIAFVKLQNAPVGKNSPEAIVVGDGGIGKCGNSFTVISPKKTCVIGHLHHTGGFNQSSGWIFIDPPGGYGAVQAYLNSCVANCGRCDQNLFNNIAGSVKYSLGANFYGGAPAVFNYDHYDYQIRSGGALGSADCQVADGAFSPLIVDLEGYGIQLTSPADGTWFDLTGVGSKLKFAWPSNPRTTAFLALDVSGNGLIDSIHELFGNNTKGPDGISPKAGNGFDALKKYDLDNNSRIDSRDAIFAKLKLWSDYNQNGISEPDELSSLSSKKLKSIDLNYVSRRDIIDVRGSEVRERSFIQTTDGRYLPIYDLWFSSGY